MLFALNLFLEFLVQSILRILIFLLVQVFFFHIAESNGTAKPFKKEKV